MCVHVHMHVCAPMHALVVKLCTCECLCVGRSLISNVFNDDPMISGGSLSSKIRGHSFGFPPSSSTYSMLMKTAYELGEGRHSPTTVASVS